MEIEILDDSAAVARRGAAFIAAEARGSVAARGRFVLAVSGGQTPRQMLRDLAHEDVPWEQVQIVQVDERIAPAEHPDRNLTHLKRSLLEHAPFLAGHIHPMPVEDGDPAAAAMGYAATLQELCGSPPVIDLVHLGIGVDGHTASLIPGDPVLDIVDADVAVTGVYQGRRRMTLTFPAINRARRILWVVAGSDKAGMLARLRAGDPSIPAGRVKSDCAFVLADREVAGQGDTA